MGDSIETFSFPESITPQEVNEIIVAAGAPGITMVEDLNWIASSLDHLSYELKSERNKNPRYRAFKKRQKELEAAHILLEANLFVKIDYERRNLQKNPDSIRSNLFLPKYERLRSALEETREIFVSGHTRQRGQRGASVIPNRESYLIFRTLAGTYRKYGSDAPKDSTLYEIIKNCFGKIGIVVTRDAIRKAIGKAERQRAAELAEFRRIRQASLVDPGK